MLNVERWSPDWYGSFAKTNVSQKETTRMKPTRSAIHRKFHSIPDIRFEDQALTSFSGLVLFQALFTRLDLKERLRGCFRHLDLSPIFGHHVISWHWSSISCSATV